MAWYGLAAPPVYRDDDDLAIFLHGYPLDGRGHRRFDPREVVADFLDGAFADLLTHSVVDAGTGLPVSSNREALRLIEPLRAPGRPAQALPEDVTCRLGDGREIALDGFVLADAMQKVGTVRAEEVVLSAPGGLSVSLLVNATPIHGEDGSVASVVVTMQDLAPLEELDRLRAEFLGMVSHELRTPLAAIKGSTATVLGASPALDPAELHQFFRVVDEQADRMRGLIGDLLDAGRIEAGTLSVSPVPTEVKELVEQARNAFQNGGATHAVLVDLPEDLPLVLADGPRIVQVLNNLLSNAARHSPGSTPIRVAALRDGPHVAVSVSDEGRGVPAEQLPRLFRKYAGDDAGRGLRGSGLGLAICKGLVEAHGGASGPRAPGRARAPGSPSPFRRRRIPPARPAPIAAAPCRPARRAGRRPCWWWTTTPGRCASFATRSPKPATPRTSPATPTSCPG